MPCVARNRAHASLLTTTREDVTHARTSLLTTTREDSIHALTSLLISHAYASLLRNTRMRSVRALWREERRVALVLRRPPAGRPGRRRRLRRADAARLRAHRLGVGGDRGDARRPAPGDVARPAARRPRRPHRPPRLRDRRRHRARRCVRGPGLRRRHRADDRARARWPGVGNALFRPATAALLPSLVDGEHLPAANALYGMVRDVGQLLGPAAPPGCCCSPRPSSCSASTASRSRSPPALLLRLRGHVRARPRAPDDRAERAARTLAGIGTVVRDPVVRTLMVCSGAVVLAAGTMNVAELVLAQQELGSGRAGFALLVSAYGCGLIAGSLLGARDDGEAGLRRRYLAGMALMVAGPRGSALAPAVGFAMFSFARHRRRQRPVHRQRPGAAPAPGPRAPPRPRVRRPRLGRGLGLRRRRARRRRCSPSTFGGRVTFAVAGGRMLIVLIAASRALRLRASNSPSASLRALRRRRASRAGSRGTARGAACRR